MESIEEDYCSYCSSLAVHLCSGDNCDRVMCENCSYVYWRDDFVYCDGCMDIFSLVDEGY